MNVKTFVLKNSNGLEVNLTNIGATIIDIKYKGYNLQLKYDNLEDYFHNTKSYGTVIGRFANRIANAEFEIDGVLYQLEKNNNGNCLHSGSNRYDSRIWDFEQSNNSVKFSLLSPDGDQGMPGNANIEVTYTLDENNALHLKYKAISDKATYFNLTNHAYFNLGGSLSQHRLQLNCDKYVAIDQLLIPTGEIVNATGHMDLRKAKNLDSSYDHCYIINSPSLNAPFAIVESEESGIKMEAYTDLPSVQLYTGSNIAFCLETQHFPDTPHHNNFPTCLFAAGEEFNSETIFRFL